MARGLNVARRYRSTSDRRFFLDYLDRLLSRIFHVDFCRLQSESKRMKYSSVRQWGILIFLFTGLIFTGEKKMKRFSRQNGIESVLQGQGAGPLNFSVSTWKRFQPRMKKKSVFWASCPLPRNWSQRTMRPPVKPEYKQTLLRLPGPFSRLVGRRISHRNEQ